MEGTVALVVTVVALGCAAYVYLLIFHPEWVGITGKSAKKVMGEHVEGSKADDSDLFSDRR